MIDKFPIGQSFQRLNDCPLDATTVFDTLAQAKDYAKNNSTAYKGQIIHVKDARTKKEIEKSIEIYEQSYYIDFSNNIQPLCSFNKKDIKNLLEIMYEILYNPTENTRDKLDKLFSSVVYGNNNDTDEILIDYHNEPWNPDAYTTKQVCLKMNQRTTGPEIRSSHGFLSEGSVYETENIVIKDEEGNEDYYTIITFDELPTYLCFGGGDFIEEVIHICDTSKITDMSSMFSACKNLTRIPSKNWNTSNVTNMYEMFYNCIWLRDIDCSNWNTSKVTNMGSMFHSCKVINDLDLSGWDTSNVTNMSYMFHYCIFLDYLDLTGWNTENVLYMQHMFSRCNSLNEIAGIKYWHTPNLEYCGSMFENCNQLVSLNLSNWKAKKVIDVGGLIALTNLETVDLSGWDVSNVEDVSGLASQCKKLIYLDLSGWNLDATKVTKHQNMFLYCGELRFECLIMNDCNEDTKNIVYEEFSSSNIYP